VRIQLQIELTYTVRVAGLIFAHIITYKVPYCVLRFGVGNDTRLSHTLHLEESETSGFRILNFLRHFTYCFFITHDYPVH
jgi:hypothetical protein